MRRRPPLLGATGLDFGYKPAISIALPRAKQKWPIDDEPGIGPGPMVTLYCDSISATKSKCGFRGLLSEIGDYHVYKDATFGWHNTPPTDPECHETWEECERVDQYPVPWHPCREDCPSATDYTGPIPYGDGATDTDWLGGAGPQENCFINLSNEYTTAVLISDAEGALPAYDSDFNDDCSAIRDLSDDETSYSIQRFKYKFSDFITEFFTPWSGPFTLRWVERFTPVVGSPTDTPMCEEIPDLATESSVHEVLEPSTNGTTTIENVVATVNDPC